MEIIQEYKISSEGIKLDVKIEGNKKNPLLYKLITFPIEEPTLALMDQIKKLLIDEIKIDVSEVLDIKKLDVLKARVKEQAAEILLREMPTVHPKTKDYILATLMHDMLGLGNIEFLINDDNLEEVVIDSAAESVKVYHKKYGWLKSNVFVPSERAIQNYSNVIARRVGRQINTLKPLLDAHLVTGDRVNAMLYPISNKGNTITIRKFARDPWTVTDLIINKTCSSEIFALIWLAIQYEFNIIISGSTASGKTSMLNVCMPFVPINHRLITIEDTRELQLPKYLYWTPLLTRLPNPEGKGGIDMLDLLVNSLRMRPDRIILGEIRKKEEAEVLFEAMHTGHSVYATLHADSINQTVSRLVNPPIAVPPNLLDQVHLNLVMIRDRKTGYRRVYQMGEYVLNEENGSVKVKPNVLFRWKKPTDELVKHNESLRLLDQLTVHAGMTKKDMDNDLAEKKRILDWMVKFKVTDVNEVGRMMDLYYLDKTRLIEAVKKNKSPTTLK